ncbi:MAG: efflux RND transporter periplasmic adaptor subunit [Psychrobacter sp.]|uniref:efflux RND transporter periplasmic adaptor subunit n=1 Tax=Psychrobacter sp. AOP7-B1-24 TaxID=3457645 RepID=UPI003FB8E8CF
MSDLSDHNDKSNLANDEQLLVNNPLPPYRQTEITGKPTSKIPLWLWPVLAVVLLIGVLLGKYWDTSKVDADESAATTSEQSSAESDAASEEQAVLSVETIVPSQDDVGNTLRADGTINAKDMANVSAKVTGVAIERILVEEGDFVKAGQVLAVFDTDAMEQQVLQAQADVAEAEATLANASADATRILPLLDIDAISKQEADRYRTAELRARASLQSSKARLSSQRLSVENARVVAPVSGVISEKTVEVGMVAGGEPLFTIIKGGILEWRADIDPKLIGEVSVGTPVRVSLPGGNSVMGEVSRIAPTADDNRQITIYASLDTSAQVRAGMYQTGEFLLGSASTQTVPNSAIVSNDGYDYVMLITDVNTKDGKSTGRIKQQRVTLGDRLGDRVAVTEPLPNDGQMVKQGGSFLNDGDLVNIVNDAASKKSATGSAEQARS